MTDTARTVVIKLNFIESGKEYTALIFSDETHETMKREITDVKAGSALTLDLLERGGFACRINLKATDTISQAGLFHELYLKPKFDPDLFQHMIKVKESLQISLVMPPDSLSVYFKSHISCHLHKVL